MTEIKTELKSAKKSGKSGDKKKRVLKVSALFAVFFIAIAYSVYKNGVLGTAKNLITLVVCAFLGYAAFYLVVLSFRVILRKRRKKRAQKTVKSTGRGELQAQRLVESEGEFSYDKKLTPLENLKLAGNKALAIIKKASQKSKKKAGKYYFVNFTLYDAIDVFDDTVDKLYEKVDGIFGLLRMQNKPIGFLEKKLETALVCNDEEKDDTPKEPKKENAFKKVLKKGGVNFALTVFSGKINAQINDLLDFIANESVLVFGYTAPASDNLLPAAAAIETAATDLGASCLSAADFSSADVNEQTTGKENKRKKKSKKVKGEKDD